MSLHLSRCNTLPAARAFSILVLYFLGYITSPGEVFVFCGPKYLRNMRALDNRPRLGYTTYMTQITRDDVLHLAQLSSLQLSDDEIDALRVDIGNILGYIEQLGELDTTGVEPTYQVTELENISRDDTVRQSVVTRETLLALAPDQAEHQVKVPKVL